MAGSIIKQGAKAVGKAAKKEALDMDKAARLARAKAQGFDVDSVLYHATTENFDEFRPTKGGVYLSNDASMIEPIFARGPRAEFNNATNAGEYFVKGGKNFDARWKNMSDQQKDVLRKTISKHVDQDDIYAAAQRMDIDVEDADPFEMFTDGEFYFAYGRDLQNAILEDLKRQGYDSVTMPDNLVLGTDHVSTVVFDPKNIRSVNAAFDPEKADSSKLLASLGAGGAALAGGVAMQDQAQAAGFDLSTAKPVASTGFDLSTAKPVQADAGTQQQPERPPVDRRGRRPGQPGQISDPLKNFLTEAAAAINRGVVDIAEFFTTDQLNAIMEIAGSDKRYSLSDIPGGVGQFIEAAQQGGQMEPGLARDIVQRAGEYIPTAMGGAAALRGAAAMLPAQAAGESAGAGVLRTVSQTTAPIEIGSAIGAGTGEVIDERLGGEGLVGGVLGGVVGALTPGAAVKAAGGIARRVGMRPQDLIDEKTGLPTVELEKALKKHNVTLASIMDDADESVVTFTGPQLKALPPPQKAEKLDDYVKRQIVKQLKQTSNKASLADKKLNATGSGYVPDDLGIKAVKAGYARGDVTAAKTADKPTRQAMARMAQIKRQIVEDSSYAQKELPLNVAGSEVFHQWGTLRNEAKKLTTQLNDLAKRPAITGKTLPRVAGQGAGKAGGLKGLQIDNTPIQRQVIEGLRNFNIDIPQAVLDDPRQLKEFINSSGVFQGSSISKNKASVKAVKDAIDILSEVKVGDAYDAHIAKRQLDEMIDYKRRSSQLTPSGERFVQAIRAELNKAVRKASPEYAKINDDLSKAIGAINSIVDGMPRKVDLFEDGAARAVGKQLRKLETNYSTEQSISNAINELDAAYRHFGNEPRINVRDLVTFNNTLDKRFGSSVRGGFQGQIEQANEQLLQGLLTPKETMVRKGVEMVAEKLKPTDEEAFNVMQRLLLRD